MPKSIHGKICSVGLLLVTLHGSAAKYWLHKGEDERDTGWQKGARKWRVGESLKQNASLQPSSGPNEGKVCKCFVYIVVYKKIKLDCKRIKEV